MLGHFHIEAFRAVAEHLAQLVRILVDRLGEFRDRLIHLDEAVAFLLELVLHELRIDEQVARLHGAGHQHPGRIKDAAAPRGKSVFGVLLPLRAVERELPAPRL